MSLFRDWVVIRLYSSETLAIVILKDAFNNQLLYLFFDFQPSRFFLRQAPNTMKSVVTACWLLTDSIGNLIVIIVELLTEDMNQVIKVLIEQLNENQV